MNSIKKYILIFIFVLIPLKVSGNCDYKELAKLNEFASYVDYDYDYVGNISLFNVTLKNINADLQISFNNKTINLTGSTYNFKNMDAFIENKIIISAKNTECNKDGVIRIINIKLPFYNVMSENTECYLYPNFKYCEKFFPTLISADVFMNSFNNYTKKFDENLNLKETKKDDINLFKKIYIFLENYGIYISLSIIFLILIIFSIIKVIKIKKRKF